MISFRQFTLATSFMALLSAQMPVFAVDYYQEQLQNEQLLKRQLELQKKMEQDRYVRQVGDKALNGFTNVVTGPLELPKSIINQVNNNYSNSGNNSNIGNGYNSEPDDNIVYGVLGGVISGSINAAGRIVTGVTDLVTAPLPTKPIVQPRYIWDDFDKPNSYGQVFRLVDSPKIEPYVAPPPRPVAVIQPIDDQTEQYSQQTNQNLDTMFRQEMQK
jgi:hypothetical protein